MTESEKVIIDSPDLHDILTAAALSVSFSSKTEYEVERSFLETLKLLLSMEMDEVVYQYMEGVINEHLAEP